MAFLPRHHHSLVGLSRRRTQSASRTRIVLIECLDLFPPCHIARSAGLERCSRSFMAVKAGRPRRAHSVPSLRRIQSSLPAFCRSPTAAAGNRPIRWKHVQRTLYRTSGVFAGPRRLDEHLRSCVLSLLARSVRDAQGDRRTGESSASVRSRNSTSPGSRTSTIRQWKPRRSMRRPADSQGSSSGEHSGLSTAFR